MYYIVVSKIMFGMNELIPYLLKYLPSRPLAIYKAHHACNMHSNMHTAAT